MTTYRDDRRMTPLLLAILSAVIAITTTLGMVCFRQMNESVKTISDDLRSFIHETNTNNRDLYNRINDIDRRVTVLEPKRSMAKGSSKEANSEMYNDEQ